MAGFDLGYQFDFKGLLILNDPMILCYDSQCNR